MRIWVSLVMVFAAGSAMAAAPVDYDLQPRFDGGQLKALSITITMPADRSGRTTLDLPHSYAGTPNLDRAMRNLHVDGGALQSATPDIVIRAKAFAPLRIRYDVVQDWSGVPGQDGSTAHRPVIQPLYFHVLGEAIFAAPLDQMSRAARFHASGFPKGWTFASTLERDRLTLTDVMLSVSVGGDFRIVTRGQLRLAVRGHLPMPDASLADLVSRIDDSERKFWHDKPAPYLVTILPLAGLGSTAGLGQSGGFAMFLSADSDPTRIAYTFAHEHMHEWIPRQLGVLTDAAAEAWLAEGFTDWMARRVLLRSGVWTQDTLTSQWNALLYGYDTSPVRAAPNAQAARAFFGNANMEQLPYWRGALLATDWDLRLRKAGYAEGLDGVLREMRTHAQGSPERNLAATMKAHGVNIAADMTVYVERGEQIFLPRDAFAPCANVKTAILPVFAYGFDAEATAAKGIVEGVDPSGPAYRAGLRNGMRILARMSPPVSDSRVRRVYRACDGKNERTISYLPASATRVPVQIVDVDPRASRQACARASGGQD